MNFSVGLTASLTMQRTSPLTEMYTLSPFVWRESDQYRLLVRAVPHSEHPAEKIARIYSGESVNGIHFKMRKEPAIAPGPGDEDIDGCEDPTLAIVSATYYVYYTGWNEAAKRGRLLLASGPRQISLRKRVSRCRGRRSARTRKRQRSSAARMEHGDCSSSTPPEALQRSV